MPCPKGQKIGGPHQPRLGLEGYARLLRAIRAPATAREAAAFVGTQRQTAARLLRMFERLGIAHIDGWVRAGLPRSPYVPVYLAGPGLNAEPPHPIKPVAVRPRSVCLEFCRIVSMLMECPRSTAELAVDAGIHPYSAMRFTRILRRVGLLYISGWERHGTGRHAAVWAFGAGRRDAARRSASASEWRQRSRDARLLQIVRVAPVSRASSSGPRLLPDTTASPMTA